MPERLRILFRSNRKPERLQPGSVLAVEHQDLQDGRHDQAGHRSDYSANQHCCHETRPPFKKRIRRCRESLDLDTCPKLAEASSWQRSLLQTKRCDSLILPVIEQPQRSHSTLITLMSWM